MKLEDIINLYNILDILSLPHNTCTLPYSQRQKSDTYKLINKFSSIEMVTNYNCVFQKEYCLVTSQETHMYTLLQNAV